MSNDIKPVNEEFSVSGQLTLQALDELARSGVKGLICNRPDGEGPDQVNFEEIQARAAELGVDVVHLPVTPGEFSPELVDQFTLAFERLPRPIHAYCRTGTRSLSLWALYQLRLGVPARALLSTAQRQGYDLENLLAPHLHNAALDASHDVLIVGAGAAGIAAASSLLARDADLDIAIIDPAEVHYYQPGWTLVGAGVFDRSATVRTMASLIPRGVHWIQAAVAAFEPDLNRVILEDTRPVYYSRLVVAPGIKLDWHGIEGLVETLGRNGVTSNYRFDLAPYTWQLVSGMHSGRALFTQPPMPIKCAGAPQKAVYLSCDHWRRNGALANIDVQFCSAADVLFGVKEYVPALMAYIERYGVDLNLGQQLLRIDGDSRRAWFTATDSDGTQTEIEREFDMIHVAPPQCAPDFVRDSSLADSAGWIDVDQNTLRHKRYDNIWGLGDAMNAPNAKTAAAARMQAPIVANNLLEDMGKVSGIAHYNGYGSCPLTVEKGRIVLAEFGYGGKLLPSFPRWLIDGQKPSRLAWILKERILPPVYWQGMLRGREWMAEPDQFKIGT